MTRKKESIEGRWNYDFCYEGGYSAICPGCKSPHVTITSDKITREDIYRCDDCGREERE